ncbi:MAG: DNA-3-methyladenine glycosylase 2 family protein [Acidobacteria bacterium]|nr:DNA-3-methyladenine glycosylase 2 family protein [Acidobacteriota bacterium]
MTDPRLVVSAAPALRTPAERRQVRTSIERLLGTNVDLREWYHIAARDPRLAPIAARFQGVKPPRLLTIFETLVNAFACQQLSLVVGLELLNRLAALSGAGRGAGGAIHYAFPAPADIVRHRASSYRSIGFSRQKIKALLQLARGVDRGEIALEDLEREDDAEVRERLLAIGGVGRWSADYVFLRGLGRLHVFPSDDVGAQNNLARWLGRSKPLDSAGVIRAARKWQPYSGMVYFHLLLDGLSRAGLLDPAAPGARGAAQAAAASAPGPSAPPGAGAASMRRRHSSRTTTP